MYRLGWMLLAVASMWMVACGDDSSALGDGLDACGPRVARGQVLACECDDGASGDQECLQSGWMSECDCGAGSSGGAGRSGGASGDGDGDGDGDGSGSTATGSASGDGAGTSSGGGAAPGTDSAFGTMPATPTTPPANPFADLFAAAGTMTTPPAGTQGATGTGGMPREGMGELEQNEWCADDAECSPGLLCYVAGGFCTAECMDDSDCDIGGASWTCGTTGTCRVDCADDGDCPDGQVCNELPMGTATGSRCGMEGFVFGF